MTVQKVKKLVIAGGGTAGWMAGALLAKTLGKAVEITLIESEQIGTVGVGEATIPTLLTFQQLLGVDEREFMAKTNATFKLGIEFINWKDKGSSYIHSFGTTGKDHWSAGFQHFWRRGIKEGLASDYGDYCLELAASLANKFSHLPNNGMNYAFHLDASLYAKFLREFAESHGLKRLEGKIAGVNLCDQSGYIHSVTMDNGQQVEGDLFVDCTGFRGLLIEGALHTGYEDWSHWLPCDRAVAVQTQSQPGPILPYTRSTAHESGWQWRIPLQSRVGNGLVYCSKYYSAEQAEEILLNNVEGDTLTKPLHLQFRTGTRLKHWNKNCIAVGLSSGFLEPLESTSIHLIQRSIVRLLRMFPFDGVKNSDIDEFNQQTKFEMDNIRDFIILHYHVTNREDSAFWRFCKNMTVPESLKHRIDLFRETGRCFKMSDELFGENSWTQVMLGQGILPESYHTIAEVMSKDELKNFLDHIQGNVSRAVAQLPDHGEYINRYCPAKSM